MATNAFTDNIRKLIASNDLPTALQQLRQMLDKSPLLDEAILHIARFEDVRKQIRLGMISHADATLSQNQIRMGLLDLLQTMEAQAEQPGVKTEMNAANSVVDSRNVVIGSTITVHGDLHIGDNSGANIQKAG